MKRKKLHIDRMDGGTVSVGAGPGAPIAGRTTAPASGGGSSSNTSGTSSGSSGSSTGSSAGASGSVIGGGSTTPSSGEVLIVDDNPSAGISNETLAPVETPSSGGNNRNSTYTIEAGVVTFSDGDSITTGDLVAIIQDYYHVEKVDDSRIASALDDPDFLAYLKKKIKRKKMKPITLNDTKQGAMQAFGSLAPNGETDEPAAGVPDTSDSWTLLGVTMKKGYWIFMAAGLAMLLFILAIVAILKRK